ncbi:MAG TPA: hypothetical protein VEL51_06260, partial [Vicinamibacterales bacterium]|nr:hypothetical protein [Vicinamibacterales bacterium]
MGETLYGREDADAPVVALSGQTLRACGRRLRDTADVHVQDELRKLYTRDPDWNALLPILSDQAIGEQLSLQECLRDFTEFTKDIPLKTVRPATSSVVYRTSC